MCQRNVAELQEQLENVDDADTGFDEAAHKRKAQKIAQELEASSEEFRQLNKGAKEAHDKRED